MFSLCTLNMEAAGSSEMLLPNYESNGVTSRKAGAATPTPAASRKHHAFPRRGAMFLLQWQMSNVRH
jgi:hypothetical protein